MFWNSTFLPHLLLFMGFLVATFNGLIAIKTKAMERPLNLTGSAAVTAGYGLVALGLLCLVGIVLLPI